MFASAPPRPAVPGEESNIGHAIDLLQTGLTAERVGRSFVIDVSFSANDPELAGSIARAYAKAYLSDQLDANFDATQQATVWLQGRLGELRESSQAAAFDVERYRAEHGLTAARGELMSEQQLSDLNSQLILAQADTANALARYTQFKSIIESGPENAVQNATIPPDKANGSVLNDLKARHASITKREADVTARFGRDHAQAVALRREQADVTEQIFRELQQLTESYRNEYEVAKSREASLRGNVGKMTGQNSEASQSLVRLRELEQKSAALATLYQTFLARHVEAAQQRSFPIAKARVISEPAIRRGVQPEEVGGARIVAGARTVRRGREQELSRNSASAFSAPPRTCGPHSASTSSATCRWSARDCPARLLRGPRTAATRPNLKPATAKPGRRAFFASPSMRQRRHLPRLCVTPGSPATSCFRAGGPG